MKLDKSIDSILGTAYAYSVTEALLNFFGVYVKDVYEYNELPDELKEVMPELVFEYLTRKETETERIEKLFVQYKPEEFGIIKPEEQKFIQDYLGITDDTPEEELIRLRNTIIEVYVNNYAQRYPDVVSGDVLVGYTDKMSAFTYVIDHNINVIRIKRLEV